MLKRQHPLVVAPGREQQFKAERLARFGIHTFLILQVPACVIQQLAGFEQVVAVVTVTLRCGRLKHRCKHLWRYLCFKGGQQDQFVGFRIIARGVFGILKIAVGAAISPVKQRFVHPLKIKGQGDGFPHPAVIEYRTLNIKRQPAGVLGRFIFVFVFDDIAFGEIFADIAGRPVFGAALDAQIECPGFERFKRHVIVEVVIIAKGVEVPASAVDRQIGRPVVFDAGIDDILPHSPVGNAVGAASQRRR